jgi:SpoVK/Ycf46/Vps4 family AAA+-type ATPase
MTTVTPRIRMQELKRLAPSTNDALRIAQQEAARLQTREVSPELLLLGVVLQGHVGVRRVLRHVGINFQTVREQVTQIFNLPRDAKAEKPLKDDIRLSEEAQNCIDWATSFATDVHASVILPEHILLGALRHQRTQPLLALLMSAEGTVPTHVLESPEQDYTSSMDQLIHARVRDQSLVYFSKGRSWQRLRGFERPILLFSDIIGEESAKHTLQEAVDFLRMPRLARREENNYLCGMLLVGSCRSHRNLLIQAVAGEAVVPLLSLSISALVGVLSDIAHDIMELEDFDLSGDERALLSNDNVVQRARGMIAYMFDRARKAAPCVLLIDAIDAIEQLNTEEERWQWLNQLLVEMDGRDYHPSMVVIAATQHSNGLAQALLHPARFGQRILLEDSVLTQTKPCPSCKRTTQPAWKHCMYCGTLLAKVCPHCNALQPELEGAHFCFECGSLLKS